MLGFTDRRIARQQQAFACATREDFQAIFSEEMSALHLLAYLLTGDESRAEQCFVAGLEDSIEGNPVFRQWARSWSKRAIIRNAVNLIRPTFAGYAADCLGPLRNDPLTEREALIHAVLQLPPFERFVFVISVLEDHSLSDNATLLSCTPSQLSQARSRALEQIARSRVEGVSQTPPDAFDRANNPEAETHGRVERSPAPLF